MNILDTSLISKKGKILSNVNSRRRTAHIFTITHTNIHQHKQSRHIKVQLWTLRNQWTLVLEGENISLETTSRDGNKEGRQTNPNVQVVGAMQGHHDTNGIYPTLSNVENNSSRRPASEKCSGEDNYTVCDTLRTRQLWLVRRGEGGGNEPNTGEDDAFNADSNK